MRSLVDWKSAGISRLGPEGKLRGLGEDLSSIDYISCLDFYNLHLHNLKPLFQTLVTYLSFYIPRLL